MALPMLAAAAAPFLKDLLANGLGLLAGAAQAKGAAWVKEKTGVDITQPMSREQLIELQRFQAANEESLRRYNIEVANIELKHAELAQKNTADARAMQVAALQQDDVFSKRFLYFFAAGWSIFTAVYLACITFITLPTSSQRYADTILGFLLGTLLAGIFNFFFGSSSGSVKNGDVLRKLVDKMSGGRDEPHR